MASLSRSGTQDTVWSGSGDPTNAPTNSTTRRKRAGIATVYVPCQAATLREGDEVEVWSNSLGLWLQAQVLRVFLQDCVADGYSVSARTVKVSSEQGVKWVYPENVASHLRKLDLAEEAKPESAGDGGGSSSSTAGATERLCKNGCGRRVQPGLTRGLKPYDTCCKQCAKCPGKNLHDANCGGHKDGTVPKALGIDPRSNLKKKLEGMLTDPNELRREAQAAFTAAGSGVDRLTITQVSKGIHTLINGSFGVDIQVSEDYATKVCAQYRDADGLTGFQGFTGLCKTVLEDRKRLWFPEVLAIKTRDFVSQNKQPLERVYEMGAKLGEGSFGKVYRVTHRRSGENRVCKKIPKSKSSLMSREQILREIDNMARLDHPNVIKVFEYFDDAEYVSQIMEECSGSELQDKIDVFRKSGTPPYDEAFICDVMKQTLRALAFMHLRRFLHKDLKPQNIMMVDGGTSIKVIDFGLAELFNPTQTYAKFSGGTLLYMAPEVFRQEMTTKVDVWSAGVILYNLMTADFPFLAQWPPPAGKTEQWWQEETIEKIKNEEPKRHARLGWFSPACNDLLWQMLCKDEQRRPDAAQCLEHKWFSMHAEESPTLSIGVVQCVEAYARMPELKKAIFLLIAHQCKVEALNELRAIFTHFDVQNHGSLNITDIRSVLIASGMGPLSAERVIHALDRNEDGEIMWTQFISAAMCVSVCRSQRCVDAAFAAFDVDQDGHVSAEDILRVLGSGLPTSGRTAWSKRLPQQIADVNSIKAEPPKHFGQALRSIAGSFFSSESSSKSTMITRIKFHAYIGQHLDFRAGDALYAVK